MLRTSVDDTQENLAIGNLPSDRAEWMLRAAFDATDQGMLVTGLDGEILAVNKRFGEIFGVSPKEALELGLDNLTETIRREPARVFEDTIELYRSRRVVLSRYSGPITDASGEIIARLWTYRDITRRHRVQEMQVALEQVSLFFDPDPDVVLRHILGLVNRHFDDTNAILSMVEGTNMLFRAVVGPHEGLRCATGAELRQTYCQFALTNEKPILIQNALAERAYRDCLPAISGMTRYLGVPIFDEAANPVGTLCIIDDQSDRPLDDLDLQFMSTLTVRITAEIARERHLRERLARHERQLQTQREDLLATNAVFEAINSAFSLLSSTTDIDDLLSHQASLLSGATGYSTALVLVHRPQSPKFKGYCSCGRGRKPKAMSLTPTEIEHSEDSAVRFSAIEQTPLGIKVESRFLAYAVRHVQDFGDVLVAFGCNDEPPQDDRRRIHLEALVEQVCLLISAHVLQSELSSANLELENAHDEILRKEKLSVAGTLAASTAHDIRNISASLGLLASPGNDSPEVTLGLIREQLGRFDILAHRLLSYAKPRMVAKEEVRINEVLEGVISLTAAQARITHVHIEEKFSKEQLCLNGDASQIEHLFVNLILNGIQSMERCGGTLSVSTRSQGESVVIKVADHGPGLTPEAQSRLFEPFVSSRRGGFGLGLYSCKRIVEAHGGTIAAKPNRNKGCTFYVTLPQK